MTSPSALFVRWCDPCAKSSATAGLAAFTLKPPAHLSDEEKFWHLVKFRNRHTEPVQFGVSAAVGEIEIEVTSLQETMLNPTPWT